MTAFEPGWDALPDRLLEFWTERHLVVLTTTRADGRPHSVPVGVALDPEQRCAWVITSGTSRKVAHLDAAGGSGLVAACQVDGARWSTIEGTATVRRGAEDVARAVQRYAARYRTPRENARRVALRIEVDRFLFGPGLLRGPA